MILTRGTQIISVPEHAKGNSKHPDCQTGFVTSVRGDVAFCRYWTRGTLDGPQLRTKGSSEQTPISNLIVANTVPPADVDYALRECCSPPNHPSRLENHPPS